MKLLAIDTSTENASIGLSFNSQIEMRTQQDIRQHAQTLLPVIDDLLTSFGFTLNQLDGIVFGRGPGSFTGLRIACSVAKAFAYSHDLPLYPVGSLEAIAQPLGEDSDVLALIDARMHEVYWAEFSQGQMIGEHVSPAEKIHLQTTNPVVLAGVGFESYAAELPQHIKDQITQYKIIYPTAESMLKLVLAGKISAISAKEALPFYIRDDVTQK